MKLAPYIHFDGQCKEAFEFYETVLGGKIGLLMTYAESPVPTHVPDGAKDRVMHLAFQVDGMAIMASDAPPGMFDGQTGFSISLHPTSAAAAERIYAALAEGGSVRMPLQETFWAERFGMLTDQFGIPWSIDCEKKA